MKKLAVIIPMLFLLVIGFGTLAAAQGVPPDYYEDQATPAPLSPDELDDLLAPIALYPDPLIAQILPAATFVDQIDQAARYVRQYGRGSGIDDQPWDLSVKAVAHYPDVLFMMDQRFDWTVALGQAYIAQPQEVLNAIQRLRSEAQATGNLYSTREQQVVSGPDYISIVPASPEYLYVPAYDPDTIYYEEYNPGYPIITFSTAFIIGAWLSRDCDWRHHRVYYHGWRGGGWVGRARPHIHDRHGVYINKRAATISVNNRVLQRDTHGFRQELRNDSVRRREGRGSAAPAPGATQPPGRTPGVQGERNEQQRPGRRGPQVRPTPGSQAAPATPAARGTAVPEGQKGGQQHPGSREPQAHPTPGAQAVPATPAARGSAAPEGQNSEQPRPGRRGPQVRPAPGSQAAPATPAARGGTAAPAPTSTDLFRGRDLQKNQPASQTGYGGYGSSRDATNYRQRGETSRESIRQQPSGHSGGSRSAPTPPTTVTPATPSRSIVAPASRPAATPPPRSVAPAPVRTPATPAPAVTKPAAPATPAPSVSRPAPMPAPSVSRPAAPAMPAAPSTTHGSAPGGAMPGGGFQRR